MELTNRRLWTLARWRIRLGLRSFRFHVADTLQGKAMIVVLILATPALWQLLRGDGGLAASELDPAQRVGALIIAQTGLILCFAVMVPVLLLKEFILQRYEEPLQAHPFALPELAWLRVAASILSASVFLSAFFYVFYFHMFTLTFERPVIALVTHALAMQLYLAILGVALAAAARRVVLGTRMTERARLVHRLAIVPFLVSFPLFVLVPNLLGTRAPDFLALLGEHAGATAHFAQVPLAAAAAAARGEFRATTGWLIGLVVLTAWASASLRSWSLHALRELPVDLNTDRIRTYQSMFHSSWSQAPAGLRHFSLFWTKDVLAPFLRRPSIYVQEQGVLLTGATGCLVIIKVLLEGGRLPTSLSGPAVAVIITAVIGALAMLHSLDSLGRERTQIALLRPVLSPFRLFTLKFLANWVYVTAHAVAHSALLLWIATMMALPTPPLSALAVTVLSVAWLLTLAGMALGFLFPDFRARHLFLPGASGLAKYLYAIIVGLVLGHSGVAHYARLSGSMGAPEFLGFTTAIVVILGVGSALAAAWGIQRLQGIER